jgi:hypothetical protein
MGITGPQGAKGDQGSPGNNGDWSTAQLFNPINTTSYTFVSSDVGKLVTFDSVGVGGVINVIVPSGLGLTQGQRIDIAQINTGKVTIIQGTGTVVNTSRSRQLQTKYSAATLICTSPNNYLLVGDISP